MSTFRTRDRRRGTKYAGILRDPRTHPAEDRDRPAVEHSESRQTRINWRLFSAALVLLLCLVLGIFFTADAFYVRSVAVGGVRYLTKEEVFAYADIASVHIFWVSAEQVRQNLLRSPAIASARVTLGWPPAMVNIIVEEREPALVWEQGGTALWVDLQGRMMAQREDRPELLRVAAKTDMEQVLSGDSGRLDEAIVFGALELQEVIVPLPLLFYDAVRGLGFRNEYGWDVWFGTGTGMAEKYAIYQVIRDSMVARGLQAGEINIVDPDHPYYTVMWGLDANSGQ
ncbi:MAG: FtsQ-type POTRA domain-containing protein [Anaerolineae bacterium]|jgi:hypothetical protein|nr:FtsQ-type POTRA domain-containing protein [Anaerolineae bacterium]